MTCLSSLSGNARRSLSDRLTRLRESFDALGERVRDSVSRIVGEAVADAVRDAVHDALRGSRSPPPTAPHRPSSDRGGPLWEDSPEMPWSDATRTPDQFGRPRWRDDYDDDPSDQEEPEDEPQDPREDESSSDRPSEGRWARAVSAGCQAAAWWLRRHQGRFSVLAAFGVGLTAGIAAFVSGPFLADGASAAASALDLLTTTDAARSGASLLSQFSRG